MIIQIVLIVLQVLLTGGSPRWGGGGGQRDGLLQLQRLPPPAILVSPHWTVHRQLLRPLPAIVCWSSWALLTPLRLYPFVDGVETLSLGAVAVVPEVTSQIVLVKNCSIWAKERIFFSSSSTDVEHLREGEKCLEGKSLRILIYLTLSCCVTIEPTKHSSLTGKGGWRYFSIYRIILARNSRNDVHQHLQIIVYHTTSIRWLF